MLFFRRQYFSRGFSLLEVLVAMLIFSIVMMGVVSYFANITRANQNTRRLQQNLEDVRFAMNRIAKTLRTSVIISPLVEGGATEEIRIFDYSQMKCYRYSFSSSGIQESFSTSTPPVVGAEKSWCASLSFPSSMYIILLSDGATMNGRFSVFSSDDTLGSERAGRVIMNAKITRANVSSSIQTTVSLRNYEEVYHP